MHRSEIVIHGEHRGGGGGGGSYKKYWARRGVCREIVQFFMLFTLLLRTGCSINNLLQVIFGLCKSKQFFFKLSPENVIEGINMLFFVHFASLI